MTTAPLAAPAFTPVGWDDDVYWPSYHEWTR